MTIMQLLIVVNYSTLCVMVFSERELTFTFAIMSSSVRLSVVCLSSVTFVRPTQTIEIFGNVLRYVVPWPSMTFV